MFVYTTWVKLLCYRVFRYIIKKDRNVPTKETTEREIFQAAVCCEGAEEDHGVFSLERTL